MKNMLLVSALGTSLAFGFAGAAKADQSQFTDFEGFKVGASIENQNGWSADDTSLDNKIEDFGDGHTPDQLALCIYHRG